MERQCLHIGAKVRNEQNACICMYVHVKQLRKREGIRMYVHDEKKQLGEREKCERHKERNEQNARTCMYIHTWGEETVGKERRKCERMTWTEKWKFLRLLMTSPRWTSHKGPAADPFHPNFGSKLIGRQMTFSFKPTIFLSLPTLSPSPPFLIFFAESADGNKLLH
jgi:hypothetical protein